MRRRPKRGDRFIHAHFLKDGVSAADARAQPGNDELYQVRVVTAVLRNRIYHSVEGSRQGTHWFTMDKERDNVRRWL